MHVFRKSSELWFVQKLDSHSFSLPFFTYPTLCSHLKAVFSWMSSEFSFFGPCGHPELQNLRVPCLSY